MIKRKIALIGATGSVGLQTIDVVSAFSEFFDFSLLTCHTRFEKLMQVASPWENAQLACTGELREKAPASFLLKTEDIIDFLRDDRPDILFIASAGFDAFPILRETHSYCSLIAVANKETLIMAGCSGLLDPILAEGKLIPVDSEHAGIHQLLKAQNTHDIKKVFLTASGGPFYSNDCSHIDWDNITPAQALKHPTWEMGAKVSLDSATMANKGIELLEAHYLFSLPLEKLDLLVHPLSLVHAMVEWIDGTTTAHLAPADMRLCIQYALFWPDRYPASYCEALNWHKLTGLPFIPFDPMKLDTIKAACLALQGAALLPWLPLAYLALDEFALSGFCAGEFKFCDIGAFLLQGVKKIQTTTFLEKQSINPYTVMGLYQEICDWIKKGN